VFTNSTQLPPGDHLAKQLRSAYDVYLAMHRILEQRKANALRNTSEEPHELLCPPCFYTLQQEPPLVPRFLAAMDGNNSLKLVDSSYQFGNTRVDDRELPWSRWLEAEEVDQFKDEVSSSEKRKVRSLL
jgi:hypothetical protein